MHCTLSGRALGRLLIVLALAAAGCRGRSTPVQPSDSPSAPSTTPVTLAGTWTGTATDSSGPGRMTWQLTQNGSGLTGSATLVDHATGVTGRGSVSGTVTGSSLRFSVMVPAGGFDGRYTACAASVAGQGTVSGSALTGTYTGSNTCSGAIAAGQLSLRRS